jgi:hypothetical protein
MRGWVGWTFPRYVTIGAFAMSGVWVAFGVVELLVGISGPTLNLGPCAFLFGGAALMAAFGLTTIIVRHDVEAEAKHADRSDRT